MKCKCGCNKEIPVKPWHKYYRHDFIKGHRLSPKLKRVKCEFCGTLVYKRFSKCTSHLHHVFCSRKCSASFKKQQNEKTCSICNNKFHIRGTRRKNNKSGLFFCSSICFGIYNQKSNHPNWKGGKSININGYITITDKGNPYSDKRGRRSEHRIVIENHLKRKLSKNELVHHIDGNKLNNSLNNLQITSRENHCKIHQTGKKSGILKHCEICDKIMYVYPHLIKSKKYCSIKCQSQRTKNLKRNTNTGK